MAKFVEPEIIKKLGSGGYGVTYLARMGNDLVAFKKAHILSSDIDDQKSRYHAMLAFHDKVAKKYPNNFVQLIKHAIIKNCKFDHREKLATQTSKHCLYTITTPVLEDTLKTWYNNMIEVLYEYPVNNDNKLKIRNEVYSFLIQFLYIYHIMENHGWYHADLQWKNIMYLKNEEKFTNIDLSDESAIEDKSDKITCPSFGKQWYVIDYDPMYSEEFYKGVELNINMLKKIKKAPHRFIVRIFEYLLFQPFWKPIIGGNIQIDDFSKIYKTIITSPKTKYISDLLPDIDEPDTLEECAIILTIVLEPDSYMKYLGLDNLLDEKEFINYVNLTKQGQYFDIDDVEYFIKNIKDPISIIKKLSKKLDHIVKRLLVNDQS